MLSTKTDFERYVPARHVIGNTQTSVRVAFQKLTTADADKSSYKLKIYIGKELGNKFTWKNGDRIALEVSKSDPRVLRLIKADPGDYQSYKLSSQKGQHYYTIVLTWQKFIPEKKECMMRLVQHTPSEGGIIIYMH